MSYIKFLSYGIVYNHFVCMKIYEKRITKRDFYINAIVIKMVSLESLLNSMIEVMF